MRTCQIAAVEQPCAIKNEIKPNATGPLCSTIATPIATASRIDVDMCATPTAKPSAAVWIRIAASTERAEAVRHGTPPVTVSATACSSSCR